MKRILFAAAFAAIAASASLADDRTMSFNSEIEAVPAPGEVVVDGKTGDWDLSAGVLSYNDPAVADSYSVWTHFMWDSKGVYMLARYRDDTPFVNATRGLNFDQAWRGDCYQARVVFDRGTPDEHQMHIDMYYSRPDARGCIYYKHGGHRDAPPYDATGPARPDQREKWGIDMIANGAKIAFAPWDDAKGYDMEVFWPWTAVRVSGKPLAPGDSFTFGLEAFWGDEAGERAAQRLADGIRDESVNRIFMFRALDGWGRVVICAEGGRQTTERQKALLAERKAHFADFSTAGSVKIAYDLPEDRDVTIAIDDADGVRVRNLIGEYPRAKGRIVDLWDCLDDEGNPVKPGRYTATVVHHRPLRLKCINSVYSAATPPWPTDGPFRVWGSNHGNPTSVATDGRHVVLLFTGTEGASGIQLITDEGKVVWADRNEFVDGTLDDKYAYGLSRSAWQNVVLLARYRLTDGKLIPFEDEKRTPNPVIESENWRLAKDESTLALAHSRLWALMPGYALVVADPKTGKVLERRGTEGLAALTDRNGKLYALTESGDVVLLGPDGRRERLIFSARGVKRGVRLGVDLDESRFAVSDGDLNQVRVFAPDGREIGVVGKPHEGRERPAGKFVETDLIRPLGADFDRLGRLWVAEGIKTCKRVTCWSRELGFVDQYWGSADYGAMSGFPFVDDPTRFIAHGVEFLLDPAPDMRNRKTNEKPLAFQPFLAKERGMVYRVNGREYATGAPGFNKSDHLSIFIRCDDGVFRPVVRIQLYDHRRVNGKLVEVEGSAWTDLNGNHEVDDGETVPADVRGSYWANGYVRDDLTILTPNNRLFVPKGFTDAGVPLYDFAHPGSVGDGRPYAQTRKSTGTPVIDRAGNVSDGIGYITKDGRRGFYPNRWGRHDAPAARRGALIAPFRVNGVVEDVPGVGSVLAMGGDRGQWFILSMDGLYLGAICQDSKGDIRLDETFIGQESFGGFFWRDRGSGRTLLQLGGNSYRIMELFGLETTVKSAVTLDVSAEDIAAGERIVSERTAKEAVEAKSLSVNEVRNIPAAAAPALLGAGSALLPGASETTVVEEGNAARWFRAALAHDARTLAIAFQVADPSPWRNGEGRFTHLFIGGDAVDVKLDVPGRGPMRLLAAPLGGKPTLVCWHKKSESKEDAITYSVGNNVANAESFDSVRRIDSAKIDVNVAASAYTVLVRVPLRDVGLDGLKPGSLKGIVGVIFSDPAGINRSARVYWHDKATGLVSDVPSESRIDVRNFGEIEWR